MTTTTRTVQIALVGWGNFSSHIHEETVRQLQAEGACRLKTVCVRSPDTRAAIIERLGAAGGTADWHEVLTDPQIDAVIVGAPQQVQAAVATAAVAAGKYAYVEKPFFADEADTGRCPEAFVAELEALGRPALEKLTVGFNKRAAPAYRALRQRCRDDWGGTRYLQLNVIDDAWRWGAKYPAGFLMWLDVCHWLDLARWWTGAEVERISCIAPQTEDTLTTLRMSDDSVCSIFLSGNATMDVCKEELKVVTAGRRTAVVTDFLETEIFGGDEREIQRYQANQQAGGDPAFTARIDAGGLEAFRAIRREQFLRHRDSSAEDLAGDQLVRRNIPNFMRPQGWNQSLREFIDAAANGTPVTGATWQDAWTGYRLLQLTGRSLAADGASMAAAESSS